MLGREEYYVGAVALEDRIHRRKQEVRQKSRKWLIYANTWTENPERRWGRQKPRCGKLHRQKKGQGGEARRSEAGGSGGRRRANSR